MTLRRERAFLHGGKGTFGVGGRLTLARDRLIWEASSVGRVKQSFFALPARYRRCEIPLSDAGFTAYHVSHRKSEAWLPGLVGAATLAVLFAFILGFAGLLMFNQPIERQPSFAEFVVIEAALLGSGVGIGVLLGGLGGLLSQVLVRKKIRGITAETGDAVCSFEVKVPEAWLRDIERESPPAGPDIPAP